MREGMDCLEVCITREDKEVVCFLREVLLGKLVGMAVKEGM